jgi:DNA polymerase-4
MTISIGGGANKLIAKLAVDRAKPSRDPNSSGVHIVAAGAEEEFLRTCTLADIPLIGPKFQERLAARGLVTIPDVLRQGLEALRLGLSDREARWLWNRVHGVDAGEVRTRGTNRGLSRDETFSKDLHEDRDIERELLRLVTRAAADLRGDGLTARTVAVRLRDWDFRTRSTQRTLPEPVISDRVILRVARELLATLRDARRVPARLVGVRLSGLKKARPVDQLAFDAISDASGETPRDRRLSEAINGVREKFGAKSILPAGLARHETTQTSDDTPRA